jgi:uncharacterized membrane protein
MKFDWRTEWPMWVLLLALFTLAAVSWSVAPDRIPVHWGLSGQPDRWGGRFEGLMMPPLLALGIYLLLLFLPRIDPGRANYATFAHTYATVRLLMLVVFVAIETLIVLWVHGRHVDMGAGIGVVLGGMFVVLGNLLGKLRPNWFVGIRTPWTLSSKESWVRTHRAGGWLFMAFGLMIMCTALIRTRIFVVAVAVAFAAGILGLIVYSYLVWRRDPDKVPPAGTTPADS